MVPDHVGREAGGKLTRYATTEEDETTLRELLLRYVTIATIPDSFPPLILASFAYDHKDLSMCRCVFYILFHLGLASYLV